MVPFWDSYNHRNGKWHNTQMTADEEAPFVMKASTLIRAGQQIYNSYGKGTQRILIQYGFVEDFPQTWEMCGENIEVDVDQDIASDMSRSTRVAVRAGALSLAVRSCLSDLAAELKDRTANETRPLQRRAPGTGEALAWAYQDAAAQAVEAALSHVSSPGKRA